jgi:iron(III) transport system permease protein
LIEKSYRKKEKYHNIRGSSNSLTRIRLGKKKTVMVLIFCTTPFLFGFLIPVVRLFTWLIRSKFHLMDVNLLFITLNTIVISLISCSVIVFLAYFINFSKNYFNNDALKKIGQLAILGYSMPGAIIAIGVLKLNSSLNEIVPLIITGSILGLIFAYAVRFLAIAWQPIESSMEKQCASINQASRTLKIKAMTSLFHINLPMLKKPLLLTCLIVFIDIAKELPLTLILRPFNFDTLATLTYDLINQAQFFQSSLPSLLIIFISVPAILIINGQLNSEN